jgi:hypothetical protein
MPSAYKPGAPPEFEDCPAISGSAPTTTMLDELRQLHDYLLGKGYTDQAAKVQARIDRRIERGEK